MRFDYLLLAEGANQSQARTQNILGAGGRVIDVEAVPILYPAAIVGAVSATKEEAGKYPVKITLTAPGGATTLLVGTTSEIKEREFEVDPTLPVGFLFQVVTQLEIASEGLYVIRARVGRARAEYRFQIRARGSGSPVEG